MVDVEAFKARVKARAEQMGKSYPLDEAELRVKSVVFSGVGVLPVVVEGTDRNMASRLWVESEAGSGGPNKITITEKRRASARDYFGDYCDDEPGTGKHAFLDPLWTHATIRINWE